jgi:hypothetical protein
VAQSVPLSLLFNEGAVAGSASDTGAREQEQLCLCGYDLQGVAERSCCPECGRPLEEVTAWYAWDFPVAELVALRRGVVLTLSHFLAFAPAVAVFALLSHCRSAFAVLAWLIPPIFPAVSVFLLTRPWPGMTRDERRKASQLRAWTVWLMCVFFARYAYDVSFRYGSFLPFDHVTRTLDGVIAVGGVLWVWRLAQRFVALSLRLDCPALIYFCYLAWFLFAFACLSFCMPDALYWQWIHDGSGNWNAADVLLRNIGDIGGVLLPMTVTGFTGCSWGSGFS